MKRWLRELADLRRGERRVTVLLGANYFLLLLFYYLLKPTRDALFLQEMEPARLPLAYVLTALVAAPVTAAYARAGLRRRLDRLMPATTLFLAASLVVLHWLLGTGQGWVLFLFYAWVGVAGGLTTSQFWLLANAVYDASQAKRLFPLLSLVGIAGAFVGGEVTGLLVRTAGLAAVDLLPVAAVVLVGAAGCGALAWRRRGIPDEPRVTFREDVAAATGKGIVRSVLASRHLLLTVGIIALTVMSASFIDFVFKSASWSRYPDGAELTVFLAHFYGRMSLLSFLVQALLAGRLLRSLGAGGLLLLLPSVLVLGAGAMVVVPGLAAAMVLRGGDITLKYSLDKTSRELLYLPIPLALKKRTKVFMDMFVDRWARGLAGLLLLACTSLLGFGLRGVTVVLLVLLAAWAVLAYRMRREYVASFRRALSRRDIDLGELRLRIDDPRSIEALTRSLKSGDRREILYALALLQDVKAPGLTSSVAPLLGHESPEVRTRAIRVLAANPLSGHAADADRFLDDPALEVRTTALGYILAEAPDDPARREELTRQLAAAPLRRNAVLGYLAAGGSGEDLDLVTLAVATAVLEDKGPDGDEGRRLLAGLGELPAGCNEDLWDRLLEDEDDATVAAAMEGAGRRGESARFPWMLEKLTEPSRRVPARRALAALAEGDPDLLAELEQTLVSGVRSARLRAEIPRVFAEVPTQASADVLLRRLATGDPELRYQVLRALGALRSGQHGLRFDRDLVSGEVGVEAGRYVQLAQLATQLPEEGDAARLLRRTIGENQQLRLESVFRLLGLIYPPRDVQNAYHGVVSGRRVLRANAQEFLENLLRGQHRRLVLSLIDDQAASAAWQVAGVDHATPPRDTAEALAQLGADCDPWLAACAIFAGGKAVNPAAAVHLEATGGDMLTPIEKVLLLQNLEVFTDVPTDQLAALAAITREVSVLEGDVIFREDDRPDALYLVLDGEVIMTRDGREFTRVGRDGSFGTWSLFDDLPRVMTATAAAETRLLRLDAADFADLLSDDVRIAQGVIRTVTRLLRGLAGRAG